MQKNNLPQWLKSWQPDASDMQLRAFVEQHRLVLDLLEDSWRRFCEGFVAPEPTPDVPKPYAAHMRVEDLEHLPVSQEELAAFLNTFDAKRQHDSNPFGRDVRVNEQDWEILE